jgi:ABC-type multidrug transport system ATPase subunit
MGVAELGTQAEAQADPAAALSARGLYQRYGDFVALAPLDLDVPAGEMVSLVGPNGAGKSTFMTMAAGLLEPSAGGVAVAGAEAGTVPARAATSFLADTPVFYEDLSLGEHLQFVAGLHGVAEHEPRATELLSRLGLEDRRDGLPGEFSHGMRQKASIALALIRPFRLLLADEPFDGLDAPSRAELMRLFAEARDDGAAVLVTTHRADVLAESNRGLALRDGDLAYAGPPDPAALSDQ